MMRSLPVSRLRLPAGTGRLRRAAPIAAAALVLGAAPLAWQALKSGGSGPAGQKRTSAALQIDPRFLEPRPAPGRPMGLTAAPTREASAPAAPSAGPATTGSIVGASRPIPRPIGANATPVPAPATRAAAAPTATAKPVAAATAPTPSADTATTAAKPKPKRPDRTTALSPAAGSAAEPSLFERLLGIEAGPPRVSYASLPGDPTAAPRDASPAAAGVAVYDISARTVTLPSGEVLEAHSGLGEQLDDPRYVHVRMRGATPPGTYDLTERVGLFHGVRAIRLNPVGGSGAVHGRAGLLAHTYMLGARGDSNGCVSFRQYDRFLQAFLRGEVKRLVVVPGSGGGLRWPGFASLARAVPNAG